MMKHETPQQPEPAEQNFVKIKYELPQNGQPLIVNTDIPTQQRQGVSLNKLIEEIGKYDYIDPSYLVLTKFATDSVYTVHRIAQFEIQLIFPKGQSLVNIQFKAPINSASAQAQRKTKGDVGKIDEKTVGYRALKELQRIICTVNH